MNFTDKEFVFKTPPAEWKIPKLYFKSEFDRTDAEFLKSVEDALVDASDNTLAAEKSHHLGQFVESMACDYFFRIEKSENEKVEPATPPVPEPAPVVETPPVVEPVTAPEPPPVAEEVPTPAPAKQTPKQVPKVVKTTSKE